MREHRETVYKLFLELATMMPESVQTYREAWAKKKVARLNAEIERLTKELAAIKAAAEDATEYTLAIINGELKAENERLRTGIERLASPEAFVVAKAASAEETMRMKFADRLLKENTDD